MLLLLCYDAVILLLLILDEIMFEFLLMKQCQLLCLESVWILWDNPKFQPESSRDSKLAAITDNRKFYFKKRCESQVKTIIWKKDEVNRFSIISYVQINFMKC